MTTPNNENPSRISIVEANHDAPVVNNNKSKTLGGNNKRTEKRQAQECGGAEHHACFVCWKRILNKDWKQ